MSTPANSFVASRCRALLASLCLGTLGNSAFAADGADSPPVTPFRFGFSSRMFTDVNENDARASLKVWATTVAKERNIRLDPTPLILHGTQGIMEVLERDEVDAAIMTCDEYLITSQKVKLAPVFATAKESWNHTEYLVLVRADSSFDSLASIRGHNLLTSNSSDQCLALPWLETELARAGLPASRNLLRLEFKPKASASVLPVFFRSADACLVNRVAFETMVELNPQIGRQMRVLARSPELVVSMACFRAQYASTHKEKLVSAIKHLHESPAGQQILALFQVSRLVELEDSDLQSARNLWTEYTRLVGPASRQGPIATASPAEHPSER